MFLLRMRSLFKRLFDITFSVVILIIILPLLVVVAVLILYKDGRPVIFLHKRVGRNFQPIKVYKFRTMKNSISGTGDFDLDNEKRITRLGLYLRKFKIDELPQFLNVLKGDLSVVGPRPETEFWVEKYRLEWERILIIRPGITDEASIIFSDEDYLLNKSDDPEKLYRDFLLPKKMEIYQDYIKHNSFWGDILIVSKTILRIILK